MRGTKTPCVKPVCISDFTKTGEQTRKKCTAVQSGSGQTCWFAYFLVVLNVICSPSWKRFDQSTQDKSTQQGDRNRHATTSASNHWHLALDCKPDLRFLCGSISVILWYLTGLTIFLPRQFFSLSGDSCLLTSAPVFHTYFSVARNKNKHTSTKNNPIPGHNQSYWLSEPCRVRTQEVCFGI